MERRRTATQQNALSGTIFERIVYLTFHRMIRCKLRGLGTGCRVLFHLQARVSNQISLPTECFQSRVLTGKQVSIFHRVSDTTNSSMLDTKFNVSFQTGATTNEDLVDVAESDPAIRCQLSHRKSQNSCAIKLFFSIFDIDSRWVCSQTAKKGFPRLLIFFLWKNRLATWGVEIFSDTRGVRGNRH